MTLAKGWQAAWISRRTTFSVIAAEIRRDYLPGQPNRDARRFRFDR